MPDKRVRVQFDFSPEALELLDQLCSQSQKKTRAELVRDALRLYEWFWQEFHDARELTVSTEKKTFTIPPKILLRS